MSNSKVKIEAMLFNPETTYKENFRWVDIKPETQTIQKPKVSAPRTAPPQLKDVHTLAPLKEHIPFGLLHKPHDILNINPSNVQRPYERLVDLERESVIKTRPRLVMTPAVSLDDVEDPRARQLLCGDMYLSDTAKGLKEALDAIPPCPRNTAPLPGNPAPSNPIFLPKLQAPYVSPEWRVESVTWDNRQLRGHCDPTKEFWLSRPLSKCRACQETAVNDKHRKTGRFKMRR